MTLGNVPIVLQPTEYAQASCILAQAFANDPLAIYLLPNSRRRVSGLIWIFHRLLIYGGIYGIVTTTPPPIRGAAIWLPSHALSPSMHMITRTGLVFAPLCVGLCGSLRMLYQNSYSTRLLKGAMPERYYYLLTIGVAPHTRCQGLGRALLQPLIDIADAASLPCALGTENPANLNFYRSFGFNVIRAGQIPGGPQVWAMLRPACG